MLLCMHACVGGGPNVFAERLCSLGPRSWFFCPDNLPRVVHSIAQTKWTTPCHAEFYELPDLVCTYNTNPFAGRHAVSREVKRLSFVSVRVWLFRGSGRDVRVTDRLPAFQEEKLELQPEFNRKLDKCIKTAGKTGELNFMMEGLTHFPMGVFQEEVRGGVGEGSLSQFYNSKSHVKCRKKIDHLAAAQRAEITSKPRFCFLVFDLSLSRLVRFFRAIK